MKIAIDKIIGEHIKASLEERDRIMSEQIKENAEPPIEGEINHENMSERNLIMTGQFIDNNHYYWVEQDGVRITSKFKTGI